MLMVGRLADEDRGAICVSTRMVRGGGRSTAGETGEGDGCSDALGGDDGSSLVVEWKREAVSDTV